ncbi:MAG: PQQ-like beta-propeller repeat protein [Bryobacteraceae bacterium]|nr:PQQ-binding-like beta-propeller repeat protein [Solibacteraceae bacterium]MCL4840304.1 PQQ-binding-like beta-propeller repeat protein [Bryobacteraceae bacterium]MCO5349603.1 PQQ-like beta-propeller repeat protein [Bryobacteraceae bacterium]
MKPLGVLLLLSLVFAFLLPAEVPGDWPRWRGPFDTGVARGDAPLEWSDTKNLAWKLAVPGLGNSSPVIWGDRLFLTTAVPVEGGPSQTGDGAGGFGQGARGAQPAHRLVVMAVDRKSGKVVWEQTAATAVPHEGFHRRYGSFASNSPVTDGKRLYTFFGSRGAFCYDLNGKLLWKYDPGVELRMRNAFGEGTAAVLDQDTLLLNFDHEGPSFLVALDAATGKPRWKVDRDEISNWSPPLVITHNGVRQAILAAPNKVRSYNMVDGTLIWECAGLGHNTIPAPVVHKDTVLVMSGYRNPKLMAIKLGGKGDLTGTDSVVWSTVRGAAYTASPVIHDGRLYVIMDSGLFSCFDATTGEAHYERTRLPKPYNFKASPVAANGKLYLSTEEGDVVVVKMGNTFEVLATNTLADQVFISSPAFADGEIYLRSTTHLFAIREGAGAR